MQTTDALGMNMAMKAMMREITSAQPGAPIRPGRPRRTGATRRAVARALHAVADRIAVTDRPEPRANAGTCATA